MMKAPRLIMVVLGVMLMTAACDLSRSTSENHVAEGVGALNAGNSSDAVRAFEAATAADDSNPNAWYYLGYARSRALSNPNGAIESLQRATDLDPRRADAPYELGYALENSGQKDAAITAYQTAVVRDPSLVGANFRLGQLLEETGQYRGAIDAYTQTIHADPSFVLAWQQLGNIYAEFGATDAAVAVFQNGIENNPDEGELRGGLGVTLFEAGRVAESIQALEGALEEGHTGTPVTMTLGMA